MISLHQIEQLLRAESYDRLIERVLANGRSVAGTLAARLHEPDARAPAACGLALQRCCELSYGPTAIAGDLASRLLAQQEGDGSFGGSFAAAAVALRGLSDYAQQHREIGEAVDEPTAAGISRGMEALRRAQADDCGLGTDAEAWAIVRWQLGDQPAFRAAVRLNSLTEAIDRSLELGPLDSLRQAPCAAA